jgi:hypothetical protein
MESEPIQTQSGTIVQPPTAQPAVEMPADVKQMPPKASEVEEDTKTESPLDEATKQMVQTLEQKVELVLELAAHPGWNPVGTKVSATLGILTYLEIGQTHLFSFYNG